MYDKKEAIKLNKLTKEFLRSDASISQIDELRVVIRFHEWKYYVENNPVISDYEYDQLFKNLQDLESQHPESISPDSPTQRVSEDLTKEFKSVKHLVPMLSLANSYNADDIQDFDKQVRKLTGIDDNEVIIYSVEPKYDGGSIALVYEDDLLVRAATRGNGVEGEEMTPNAKAMSSVPLRAEFSKYGIKLAELRGEAVISKPFFEKLNKKKTEAGETLFANPRNSASGGLRTKDPTETRNRGIEAFIFQLAYAVDDNGIDHLEDAKSHISSLETISKLGFKVPIAETRRCRGVVAVMDYLKEWEEKRENYPYEIDGMVIKVDDFEMQRKCGSTSHHPRWAIAYKFKAKQATTVLLDVEYQVGKIGSITPVAKVEPVHLAGVTISSISLHNEEFIQQKDLRIGDQVLIERAGDVIPYIVKPIDDLRDGNEKEINFPTTCPINDTDEAITLIRVEGESAWRCPNCVCGAQPLQRLIFHVSKPAMNIDGFGKSYVEKFFQMGWITNMSDIYNLPFDKIQGLEGFGEKSVDKLQSAIVSAKSNPIHRLLHSLSIHHLGSRASKLIAERIEHVLDLTEWTEEQLTDIKDIGPVVAQNVLAFFKKEENIRDLRRMEELGVNLNQTEEDKPLEIGNDAPLIGKTILFTGTLLQMGRKEAQSIAEKAGAKNISAVSKNLDILVVGEKAGSKLKKAKSLGTVEIMTEVEFIKLVK